jgi:predicted transposase YdaD
MTERSLLWEAQDTGRIEGWIEGKEVGRRTGLQEGRKAGLKEGEEKGQKKATINFALKLLQKGISPNEIEELTGLTASEISALIRQTAGDR